MTGNIIRLRTLRVLCTLGLYAKFKMVHIPSTYGVGKNYFNFDSLSAIASQSKEKLSRRGKNKLLREKLAFSGLPECMFTAPVADRP